MFQKLKMPIDVSWKWELVISNSAMASVYWCLTLSCYFISGEVIFDPCRIYFVNVQIKWWRKENTVNISIVFILCTFSNSTVFFFIHEGNNTVFSP